jgi:hypothetical protein
MNRSARTLEIILCIVACVSSAGCDGETASPDPEGIPSGAVPRSAPDADIAGGPFFLVTTTPIVNPEFAWLVSGDGEKTRLEGIVGETPHLFAHDGKLWLRSQTDDPQAPSPFWLQPVANGALGEAVPDFFPEPVALSFDGRYALSQGDGVRLYEWGASEPTVVFDGNNSLIPLWSPTALEFLYREDVAGETYDLHFVEVKQGVPSAPRRLVSAPSRHETCDWSRDGRWVVCFRGGSQNGEPRVVIAFDRENDLASHEFALLPNPSADTSAVGVTAAAVTADSKYVFAWSEPSGQILIATISGDERYTLEMPPGTAVGMHPTASWLALNRPDGTAELVTMDRGSPTRVSLGSLGAGERVFFGYATERLGVADAGGATRVRLLIRNGERWETLHEVTDPTATTSLTTDLAHAVIVTQGELQSLTVASGSRPEVLPVETESQPFIEYRGHDHLLFRETVSDDFARLHLVSWPEGAATVVTVDFEKSNLRAQAARGMLIAGP